MSKASGPENVHSLDFKTVEPLPCPFCGVVPDVLDYGWMHPKNDCILRLTVVTGVGDWNRRDEPKLDNDGVVLNESTRYSWKCPDCNAIHEGAPFLSRPEHVQCQGCCREFKTFYSGS